VFDGTKQLRVFLRMIWSSAKSACPLLHLLERLARIDALMLARVADKEHTILRADLLHERLHLPGAGKAGFIHHI